MQQLNVGIVGFGLRAGLYRHVENTTGARVSIVCDTSEKGRADAATRLPDAVVTESLDELIASRPDAVLVLTPDNQHASVGIATLRAGIPTFCEKPLDVTLDATDALLTTAYETGTRLYVGHNMRHMPVIRQMREVIEAGTIGEVKAVWCRHFVGHGGDYYFKDWHAERANSTSLLLQKGAHDIDVVHWLAGGYTRTVSAIGDLAVYGQVTDRRDNSDQRMFDWFSLDNWPPLEQKGLNPIVDVEDISMMQMRLDNGVLASYQQCHFTPDYWRNYTVIGTAGRIENLGDGPGEEIHVWTKRSEGRAEPDQVITIADGEGGHGGADPKLIAEFLRFAVEGGLTDTSPVAAREAVAAGVIATQSLRGDGSALRVPELPAEVVAYFDAGQPARDAAGSRG
ncbi:oxidoreductase with transcriptional repressor domain [Janibacter sp. HTCC2649]|uniref:Gfo/Idh/MocA family protein n=1 Tax=Janibacter sp. HTCC2649 TaxID=313589 RepID=UPI0000671ACA|nr:Gfo/Idh/MocA family oxidoreductase [Janibacter sp. HTCC2649]EAP98049.1 oxidoreductase with transcriptional repressor domain [Janibacter sp. HTCC2649]